MSKRNTGRNATRHDIEHVRPFDASADPFDVWRQERARAAAEQAERERKAEAIASAPRGTFIGDRGAVLPLGRVR
jgi:hypothetical protein